MGVTSCEAHGTRASITGLDWIGIPVYQAVRPNSRNVPVSLGKGLTRAQAKVSALMESLEGFHAEEIRLPVVRDTVRQSRYLGSRRAISICDCLRATLGKT